MQSSDLRRSDQPVKCLIFRSCILFVSKLRRSERFMNAVLEGMIKHSSIPYIRCGIGVSSTHPSLFGPRLLRTWTDQTCIFASYTSFPQIDFAAVSNFHNNPSRRGKVNILNWWICLAQKYRFHNWESSMMSNPGYETSMSCRKRL